ncbi:MAG: CopD family protein, partial [Acidimicrobiales bacterium]
STDSLTWVLGFDDPLPGGTTGVRWTVQAPDAHPIDGSFSFSAPAAASVEADAVPEASEAPSTSAATPEPTRTTVAPATQPTQTTLAAELAAEASSQPESTALADFLNTEDRNAAGADATNTVGRLLGLIGATVGIGGLIFAALVMRGHEGDIRSVLFWVRRAGILLTVGAIVELVAQVAVTGGRWSALWSASSIGDIVTSSFAIAVGLRFLGGALLTTGAQLGVSNASTMVDPTAATRELATTASAGSTLLGHAPIIGTDQPEDKAWRAETGLGAFLGAALILISFVFDGHTVTEGNRTVHAFVNMAHVAAGTVWAGGLLMLADVVWRRHRRGADTRALQLAVRFSVVAASALVIAGIAGTVLAVIVLDSVSEIWSTAWGRLLLAKVAIVAAAASAGGYNHKVLIPRMTTDPDDSSATERFRAVVTAEAIALILVVATTAFLVGAAS